MREERSELGGPIVEVIAEGGRTGTHIVGGLGHIAESWDGHGDGWMEDWGV